MAVQVKVPTVGESITEVTIGSWHRKDGDTVEMDEVIAELESDKATFELTAPEPGVLRIVKQEGETVPVGEVVCEIEPSGAEGKSSGGKAKQKAAAGSDAKADADAGAAKAETSKAATDTAAKEGPPKVHEMRVPAVGESITEVTLSTWLKKDGDRVELDEIIAEVESDKATFELPAEAAGILRIAAKENETLPVGGLICTIEVGAGDAPAKKEAPPSAAPAAAESSTYAAGHPSPAAAKILEEKGIKADDVKGTGRDGRITKEDAMKAQPPAEKSKPSAPEPDAAVPVPAGTRNTRREKMSSLRRTIARRLVAVRNETAMLTTFNEVDMKAIMDLRSQFKDKFKEKYGIGLGFMSFFTKAVCQALKEWPAVNAQLDGDEIIYHDYCDVSIAVSTPRGLVVPVVRNADALTFDQIESEIARLAVRARDGKLSIDEMQGGTFSITNGGVFGSMLSTPILNPPQAAILGMHNIVQRPVVKNGEIVIRPVMFVALSYDHRIIDGRESVSFLFRVKELLEDPGRLMLGV
ncbi:MAG TPA: 2-oxoglutarate dehydrogenase complex dihydrolipoyllysine-residue succinyltransferase [Cyclobacteriaceae bacterium]|nr:2-oxoglutarate dehydrogenase complex dihydrolipoyllysine-residue succinyltransferase [Cyclobacteriaceae bacterium]